MPLESSMDKYRKYSQYLKEKYGARVHRIPLQAGFYCPNRDGRISSRGCIFCDIYGSGPTSFNPPPIKEQIQRGIEWAKKRYGARYFIAYFQAFTNTYNTPAVVEERLKQALPFKEVVEISLGTRPDCLPEPILDVLESIAKQRELWVEIGLESAHLKSLIWMRRGHTLADFIDAVLRTKRRKGIKIGAHVIIGVPGESRREIVETARIISSLPIDAVKIHPLHVLRNTDLEKLYEAGKLKLLTMEQFVSLAVDFIENLRKDIILMRISGERTKELFVAPEWALKKQEVLQKIEEEFERRGTHQGSKLKLGLSGDECVPYKEPIKLEKN